MTIFFASNTGQAYLNPAGVVTNSTSNLDTTFVATSSQMSECMLEIVLPSAQSDLWIHFDANMSVHQNNGNTIGGWNISANRWDWYYYRAKGTTATSQLYYWNGSSYVTAGAVIPWSESERYHTFDFHVVTHSSAGVIQMYYDSELLREVTGINTSNFASDLIRIQSMLSSPMFISQMIVADECTIGWKLANSSVAGVSEGTRFVGSNLQALAGATSGSTNISLSSGLTGGIASAVSADDYVVAVFAVSSTADRTLSITDPSAAAYTLLGTELYANDTYDANLRVAYKKMGSTPDAYVTFGNTGATNDAGVIGVYVLRGVDLTTFLDVAVATVTGLNGGNPDIGSTTPVTLQASTLFVGATAHDGTLTSYTNVPGFRNFVQQGGTGVNAIRLFIGMSPSEWASGSYNPVAVTGNVSVNTFSWGGMAIVMKPLQPAQTFSDAGTGVANINTTSGRYAAGFVSSPTADQIFRARSTLFTPPSTAYQVKGVAMSARTRRGDTGPQSANPVIRSAKTDYHKSDISIGVGLDPVCGVWETDPATSAAWTMDNANYAMVGVRSRT